MIGVIASTGRVRDETAFRMTFSNVCRNYCSAYSAKRELSEPRRVPMGTPIDKTTPRRHKNLENLPRQPKYTCAYAWRDPYTRGRPPAARPLLWIPCIWVSPWIRVRVFRLPGRVFLWREPEGAPARARGFRPQGARPSPVPGNEVE